MKRSLLVVTMSMLFAGIALTGCSCHKKITEPTPVTPVIPTVGYAIHWEPTCSPDGQTIAFYGYQKDTITNQDVFGVYKVNIDGSNFHLFVPEANFPNGEGPGGLDWSPDGNWLAFDIFWNTKIFKFNAVTGDSITCLTPTSGANYFPDWSPDGKLIAFDHEESDSGSYTIWRMDADGSNRRRISTNFNAEQRMPSWHPNGKWIACKYYSHDYKGMAVIDTTGVIVQQVLTDDANRYIYYCRFSPDGSKIAFLQAPRSVYDITAVWCVNIDGSNLKRLTDFYVNQYSLGWTPDGRILFAKTGVAPFTDAGIWIMNSDGTNKRQITFPKVKG